VRARDGTITTFDVSGAGTGPNQGTIAADINPDGAIAGYFMDASNVAHGFVRAPRGTITTFDAPGAGTGSGQGTYVNTIDCLNPAGEITGDYLDASGVHHGYVRATNGVITTFDAAGVSR
jgi:hypothetical protein